MKEISCEPKYAHHLRHVSESKRGAYKSIFLASVKQTASTLTIHIWCGGVRRGIGWHARPRPCRKSIHGPRGVVNKKICKPPLNPFSCYSAGEEEIIAPLVETAAAHSALS